MSAKWATAPARWRVLPMSEPWRWLVLCASLSAAGVAPACAANASQQGAALTETAHRDDVAGVADLLKHGTPVNAAANDGATALAWAVANGDRGLVQVLLKAGANPNRANDYGVTPLILAAQAGDAATADLLLKAHARPDLATWAHETPLMFAARAGALDTVASLLRAGAMVNARESRHGQTALMWAAGMGRADVVRALLAKKADASLATPKIQVSSFGPARAKTGKGGFTALLFAVSSGDKPTVQELLDASQDVNRPAIDGTTALLLALYRHVNPMNHFPYDTEVVGDLEMARLLLDHGANVNAADAEGVTPLAAAVFIAHGSDVRGQQADEGVTLTPHDEMGEAAAKMLLAGGADPNKLLGDYLVPIPSGADRRTPGRYANVSPFLLAAAFNKPRLMQLMLESGRVNVNKPRLGGNTPLMDAVQITSLSGVKAFVEAGADVNAANGDGQTALHLAANGPTGAGSIVQYLIQNGARLDLKDNSGRTPSQIAAAASGGRGRPGRAAGGSRATTAMVQARGRPPSSGATGSQAFLALATPDVPKPADVESGTHQR
jgi:ankyrin repeat protein